MALTALSTPAVKSSDFAKKVTGKQLPTPRLKRVTKLSEVEDIYAKLMFFGDLGKGKTFFLTGLLEAGHKVLVITTDVGGDGLNTVRLHYKKRGRVDLLDNAYSLILTNDDEVQDFIIQPTAFFPEIYDSGIDVLFWDGFSSWAQIDVSDTIGGYAQTRAASSNSAKEISEARQEGYQFETSDWGILRNIVVKSLDKFCALKNEKTGQPWHKIVTCQEGFRQVKKQNDKSELVESKMPALQGMGGKFSCGAFDLIVRCDKEYVNEKPVYLYKIDQENLVAKNRGFNLQPVEPAEPLRIWKQIASELGFPLPQASTAMGLV